MLRRFLAAILVMCAMCGAAGRAHAQAPDAPDGPYPGYFTYPGVQAKIAEWKQTYPALVTVGVLGKTLEGRDIPLLRVSAKPTVGSGDVEVLLLCGIHPREQQPIVCLARFVDELLAGYGKDARLTAILKTRQIWIIPMFNVDGKVYDMQHGNGTTKGADWRKNRRPNADGTMGVDLNRNFGIRWGGSRALDPLWQTTTDTPSGNIYEGPSPLSEPETRALADFVHNRKSLVSLMDIHSPLHEIVHPAYLVGGEHKRFTGLVKEMQNRQKTEKYKLITTPANTEPPAAPRGGNSGLTYTWAYYTQGVYGINFEVSLPVRYPPPADIHREYEANVREAWLYYLEAVGAWKPATPGTATCEPGPGTFSGPLSPGATVAWTPPPFVGRCDWAVLVSTNKNVVVPSEFRLAPLRTGFTLQVPADALPGAVVPLTLYLWDSDRHVSSAQFTVTVAKKAVAYP